MKTTIFSTSELQKFFSGKYFHKAYTETSNLANDILVHADGIYPEKLIEKRRPSESLAVKNYRKEIWQSVTKSEFGRVHNGLSKIRKSTDWSIRFDINKQPSSVRDEDGIAKYFDSEFPEFTSITNWAFSVLLKTYLTDANALICVFPIMEKDIAENSYVKPIPNIFYSNQIIDHVVDDYCVLKSTDKIVYGTEVKKWGDVYYIITTQSVQRYEQIREDKTMKLAWEYLHNLGELPVIKTKGNFKKALDGLNIYESRLATMVPHLNEAIREYSDLQAEVVQNIFSEKWEMVTDECTTCKGKGTIKAAGLVLNESNCTTCSGTGNKPRGPYTTLQIKPPMAGEQQYPTPPMGYIQKDTTIIEIQDKRIDKHIYKALCAINFQFLDQSPLNQSGKAKEVDKDELNTFVNSIAEDIVSILDKEIYYTTEMRYSISVPDKMKRMDMLPFISVPEKFDILSTNYLETELKNAKENKTNPVIVVAIEKEYANKKFSNDPAVRDMVSLILALDPMAGVHEDDKMTRLSNKGITMETYVVSCNIHDFVLRAIDEKGDAFFKMVPKEQKILMKEYAKEQIAESSVAATVLMDANGLPISGGGG
jgi:hypothetical protein